MTDQDYREIHLSAKQLVFLFMASVVLAVAVFLLGVSVGRGVREATGDEMGVRADLTAPGDTEAPVEMPPPTETTPDDLRYHDQLQGQTPPPPRELPAPVSEAAAPTSPPSPPAEPEAPAEAAPAPPPAPRPAAPTAAAPPAAAPSAATRASGWVVQVAAFGSRGNADALLSRLKGKGYAAYVESAGPRGSLLRVAVGPFPNRADADRTAARLQKEEGLKPLVTR